MQYNTADPEGAMEKKTPAQMVHYTDGPIKIF
jgi:hypothetical protein